jgi:hypothetical protein
VKFRLFTTAKKNSVNDWVKNNSAKYHFPIKPRETGISWGSYGNFAGFCDHSDHPICLVARASRKPRPMSMRSSLFSKARNEKNRGSNAAPMLLHICRRLMWSGLVSYEHGLNATHDPMQVTNLVPDLLQLFHRQIKEHWGDAWLGVLP